MRSRSGKREAAGAGNKADDPTIGKGFCQSLNPSKMTQVKTVSDDYVKLLHGG